MPTCLIQQPSGLGDILLAIKIGCHYADIGYDVVWPVFPVYANLNDKIKTNEKITFYNLENSFPYKEIYLHFSQVEINQVYKISGGYDGDLLFVPLKRSFHSDWGKKLQKTSSHDASNMLAKFLMCGIEYNDWQDYFEIKRNFEKEQELFNLLNLKDNYHLVNKMFGTPPVWNEILNKEIKTPNNLKRVEMDYIPGYNIFDWIKVFEKASKIDTVSTSTFYFFEKLNLVSQPTIYSRNTSHRTDEENFDWLKTLARKNYNFIS